MGNLFEFNVSDGINASAGSWLIFEGNSCYSNGRDGYGRRYSQCYRHQQPMHEQRQHWINMITSSGTWIISGNIAVQNGTSSITYVDGAATIASNATDQS